MNKQCCPDKNKKKGLCRCKCHREEPKANFLQVGRTIECGHCHPEKYPDCKTLTLIADPVFKSYKCNCICHDPQPQECKHEWSHPKEKCEFAEGWHQHCNKCDVVRKSQPPQECKHKNWECEGQGVKRRDGLSCKCECPRCKPQPPQGVSEEWVVEFDNLLEEKLFPYPCQECGFGQDGKTNKLVKSFIRQLLTKERESQRSELLKETKAEMVKEFTSGQRCHDCGELKQSDLSDSCAKCLEEN